MEENKFERQVQQKLDELKLNPSDSVWEHVKVRIDKKKDKRWMLLILFLFSVALLLGGYFYFLSTKNLLQKKYEANNITSKEPVYDSIQLNEKIPQEKIAIQSTSLINKNLSKPVLNEKNNSAAVIKKNENFKKRKIIKEKQKGNVSSVLIYSPAEIVKIQDENGNEIKPTVGVTGINEDTLNKNSTALDNEGPVDKIETPTLSVADSSTMLKKQKDTLAKKVTVKKISIPAKDKLHFGFFISGGISHATNQFLGFGNKSADFLPSSLNSAYTPGTVVIFTPSKINNSTGFVAGIFLEKSFFAKTKISFGINYKDFNTSNIVGKRNDTTGNYSSINAQQRYYNNFKFIEFPLQIKMALIKRKPFPLLLHSGITLTQLISNTALQFDSYSGVYYKDNSLFNKTRLGLTSSLSTILLQNKKFSILAGPYIYYEASQSAKRGLYNKKHFIFIGLQTEVSFGKK